MQCLKKNLPVAHEYQYQFHNEARGKEPRFLVFFTCSRSTCSIRGSTKSNSCLKSKQQCQSALGRNVNENVLQRGVGLVKQRHR